MIRGINFLKFAVCSFLIIFLLNGCNTNVSTKDSNEPTTTSFKEIIALHLSSEMDKDAKNIDVLYSKETEFGLLTYFTFKSGNMDFEGLASFIDNNGTEITNIVYEEINIKVPFTHIELTATKGQGVYRILGGQINSEKINYVNISFFNGILAKVLKSEVNSYAYVDLDDSGGVSSIKGFDVDDVLIFEY